MVFRRHTTIGGGRLINRQPPFRRDTSPIQDNLRRGFVVSNAKKASLWEAFLCRRRNDDPSRQGAARSLTHPFAQKNWCNPRAGR